MSGNTFTKYTKYTVKELESYVADPDAYVQKIEWDDFVAVLPKFLGNISEGVRACLLQKIGTYDRKVDGIILAFKNTKILSPLLAIRPNSVRVHVKVKTELYVFRPIGGSVIGGTVQYVSSNYLSAVIYRVFNVTIKLQKQKLKNISRGSEIKFVIKSFDMKNDLPYIEGELVGKMIKTHPKTNGINAAKHKTNNVKHEMVSDSCSSDPETTQNIDETVTKLSEPDPDNQLVALKTDSTKKRKREKDKLHNIFKSGMRESIKSILTSFGKDISDATNDVGGTTEMLSETFVPDLESSTNSSKRKKKNPDSKNMALLEAEILRKYAIQQDETELAKPALLNDETQKEQSSLKAKKSKKKKKSRSQGAEDDFEASIMSSIFKCATEAGANISELLLAKKHPKEPRKSVRFDDTITEASFSVLDSSELLEISQLKSPALSSTLKDSKLYK
ncbi:uncharacterized protein LOC131683394 [Topomyia yanbarensis]|uniref:uncharacterized protein LOC131683394 n=1 Tax=Topomyia yanbarensis TaxID=2498891 RepID=UPI00273CDE26|nr:uncharacterized protein LOC131683394 [Topomyia yanbarensis]